MENEMTMTNGLVELTAMDTCEIDGGVNWDRVYAGALAYGGATLAICMATGPIGAGACIAYYGICAASGAYIGYGLAS